MTWRRWNGRGGGRPRSCGRSAAASANPAIGLSEREVYALVVGGSLGRLHEELAHERNKFHRARAADGVTGTSQRDKPSRRYSIDALRELVLWNLTGRPTTNQQQRSLDFRQLPPPGWIGCIQLLNDGQQNLTVERHLVRDLFRYRPRPSRRKWRWCINDHHLFERSRERFGVQIC